MGPIHGPSEPLHTGRAVDGLVLDGQSDNPIG